MIVRPTAPSDLDRVLPLIVPDPATGLTADTYRTRLADGEYRPDWTWVAEDAPGGAPLALAVWWGDPDGDLPDALDAVFVHDSVQSAADRTDLAAQLLTAAHAAYAGAGADAAPEYHLVLPGDWRDRPEAVAAVAWRREAARRAGLPVGLERLRYEWTPPVGLPEPSGRLVLQPEPEDEVFVDLFRRVLVGTLDADSRKEAERLGAEAQARADVAFYRDTMLGDRSWWRIARTPDGEPVGFGIPSRNHAFPVVGYLGVVPEHRGRRYGDDILAEITRILAAETAPERVRADTDLVNTPMSAAFDRLGYRNDTRRLVLSPH
ncbi:GNAT family N-acetyltransferase [Kitasatospora sp. NPDC090091]|uniref:GNAT family N-acetyltransferase n=1 Tax=Kitasatospora sp. NPDC090091 TaxID=3364081 RepID=UPI0037F902E7